ncbi:MAG: hypothetical protein ACKOYK_02450 [Cyanobium sp.]
MLAKAGKPWARLMPLSPPAPQRIPGRLRSRWPLRQPDVLLQPTAMADLPGLLQADGFGGLPSALSHGLRAGGYSHAHRDPFDRMLAAQAELERLVLVTADPQLSAFPCQILW